MTTRDRLTRTSQLVAIAFALTGLATTTGCSTLPKPKPQRALYSDLRQAVDMQQRVGWAIDSAEIEEAMPVVLESVCQTPLDDRDGFLDWLDRRIEQEGGDPERAYRRAGDSLVAIHELLTLSRMRAVMLEAELRADDCPFFLDPDPEFSGVQTDTDKFLVLAESFGGGLLLINSSGNVNLGGAGSVRVLPAYGLTDRWTLALGVEVGAQGAIQGLGQAETSFSALPTGGIPLVGRYHDDTWIFDGELALLTQYRNSSLTTPGMRLSVGAGVGTLRIAGIMPYGLLAFAYEYFPQFEDIPTSHGIRLGTRVGLNWDP